jgi:NADH dehydrogenase
LFVHLIFLIGFRNKVFVLIQWAYSYVAYKRSARIITYLPQDPACAADREVAQAPVKAAHG